jgi:hypothetical protein
MDFSSRTRLVSPDRPSDEPQHVDWLRPSLLSGFIATFAMTTGLAIGYGIASGAGSASGNTFERWMYNLAENRLTADISDRFLMVMVANLVFGLIWAVLYARFFVPMLGEPGWKTGVLFSLIPWALSVCVFFPLAGAGFLGMDLDAGPLPVLGNLLVHLVYGSVLGSMYAIDIESGLDGSSMDRHAAMTSERGAAIGLAFGGILGAVGGWLVAGQFESLAGESVIALAGALSGGAVGTMLGSLIGMSEEVLAQDDQPKQAPPVRAAERP